MSLDRIQSKFGLLSLQAEPGFTVASSLSSIASNQLPGGYNLGREFAIAPAVSGSLGGGGPVWKAGAIQTYGASSAMISHDNAPLVLCSLSAGGLHQLQPANYHGQMLTIVNVANVSGSIASVFNTASGNGTLSTTTATVYGNPALTYGSSGGTNSMSAQKVFVARSDLGGTVGTNTANVWYPLYFAG